MRPALAFLGHLPTNCAPSDSFFGTALQSGTTNSSRRPWRHHTGFLVTARIAIVGTVPDSFSNAILAPGFKPSDISLHVARTQHKHYCTALSTTSVKSLLQLPSNPTYPDSIFVEDPVVVISEHTAFMARAGHSSREGESGALIHLLEQLGLGISRHADVSLDGGDVLKMNHFILVGITERTEPAAIPLLQSVVDKDFQTHSPYEKRPRVIGVPVDEGLHLKSLVTWVGSFGNDSDGFFVAPDTKFGRELISRIASSTKREWDVVWVDESEVHAANVLYIPPPHPNAPEEVAGHILVQKTCPGAVEAIRTFVQRYNSDLRKTVVVPVDTSEFWKANGALTCMSVII